MTVWLVRAGAHGEHESRFLQEKRVFLTFNGLDIDLKNLSSRSALSQKLGDLNPEAKDKTLQTWVSQVWPFAADMAIGDLVITPLKAQRKIQVGEITGGYEFMPQGPNPYYHSRKVSWIGESIPRSNFGKDLLNSFGAFLTICRIEKNNAEQRIKAMRLNNWQPETITAIVTPSTGTQTPDNSNVVDTDTIDLEEAGLDQIARVIEAKFKQHAFTRLIEGILKAQGYTTYRSPEGADGGADILAGSGPFGFGSPRLCVEVKSEANPIDRPSVDKLMGAVTKFGAQEGLFVSWSGFKPNVQKELAASFFRVRLWSQTEILDALFEVYDRLDEELKAELPLKRIWTVAIPED
jgi:restriction system protein